MKKKSVFLLSILLLIFCFNQGNAQNKNGLRNSLLWRISGNGLEQPSYLFGTVHILDSAYYFLDKTTVEQLRKSEMVVFENDLDEPGYQQKALKLAMMENDSLSNLLTNDEFQRLDAFMKKEFKIPLSALHKMKPFYVASVIGTLSMPQNSKSYENELINLAKEYEKEVLGITNPEIESEIISQIPKKIQIDQIWEAMKQYDSDFPQREKIMKAYRNRDINKIYSIMRDDEHEEDVVYDLMFPERHKIWVPNMIELMKNNVCFFAVGVGHLPGERLLNTFMGKGYKVRPVNIDFKLHD